MKPEQIIAIELIKNEVESNIYFLSDSTKVRNSVRYENKVINEKLKNEFDLYKSVLQKIVDSYYFRYYEISCYEHITLENIDYAVEKNLEILKAMKKLIKFAE